MKINQDAPYIVDGGLLPQLLLSLAIDDGYESTGQETSAFIYFSDEEHEGQDGLDELITEWFLEQVGMEA